MSLKASLLWLATFVLAANLRAQAPPSSPTVPDASNGADLTADAIIKKVKETYASLRSYSDTGTIKSHTGDGDEFTTNFKTLLQRPGLYKVEWQGTPLGPGVAWSDGTGDFLRYGIIPMTQKQESRSMGLAGATGISDCAAANIPDTFFADPCGVDVFRGQPQRKKDEIVDGVDCYVTLGVLQDNGETLSTTLWIGKKDFLIHRLDDLTVGWTKEQPIEDSFIAAELKKRKQPVTPASIADLKNKFIVAQKASMDLSRSSGGTVEDTESHVNIVTNKLLSPADFKPTAD